MARGDYRLLSLRLPEPVRADEQPVVADAFIGYLDEDPQRSAPECLCPTSLRS